MNIGSHAQNIVPARRHILCLSGFPPAWRASDVKGQFGDMAATLQLVWVDSSTVLCVFATEDAAKAALDAWRAPAGEAISLLTYDAYRKLRRGGGTGAETPTKRPHPD